MKKIYKHIGYLILTTFIMMHFSGCSSAQKLQTETPFTIGEVSSQKWIAGVQGGGAGINVLIPVSEIEGDITLDRLYYHGKEVSLEKKESGNTTTYIARYKTGENQPIKFPEVNSEQTIEEVNKKKEVAEVKPPFELKDDEALLVYSQGKKLKYYKIEGIISKQSLNYPSANKQKLPQIKQ